MITVELTVEEAKAVADLIWGNSVDTRWLCSTARKITAALDEVAAGLAPDPGAASDRAVWGELHG